MNTSEVKVVQDCIDLVETYHRLKSNVDRTHSAYMHLGNKETALAYREADDTFGTFKSKMSVAVELMDKLINLVQNQASELQSDRD